MLPLQPSPGSEFPGECLGSRNQVLLSVSTSLYRDPNTIRDETFLGWKGAAFAAFGDIVVAFLEAEEPLVDSKEGVKLGESTLKRDLLPLLDFV